MGLIFIDKRLEETVTLVRTFRAGWATSLPAEIAVFKTLDDAAEAPLDGAGAGVAACFCVDADEEEEAPGGADAGSALLGRAPPGVGTGAVDLAGALLADGSVAYVLEVAALAEVF